MNLSKNYFNFDTKKYDDSESNDSKEYRNANNDE